MTQIKQTDLRQGWRNPINTEFELDTLDPVKWQDIIEYVSHLGSAHLLLDVGGTGYLTIRATEFTKQKRLKLIVIHDKVKIVF